MEGVSTFFEASEVNFDSIKNVFQTPQPTTFMDEVNAATSLSWTRVFYIQLSLNHLFAHF